MLNTVNTEKVINKRIAISGLFLMAAVFALLPISSQAQCANWDASGQWNIIQKGQKHPIVVKLEQKGSVITGSAELSVDPSSSLIRGFGTIVPGTVDGTIDGDSFSVQIFWVGNQTGVYNATVLPSGRLDGDTYDKRAPNARQTWRSEGVLKCSPILKSSGSGTLKPSTKKPTYQGPRTFEPPPVPGGSVPASGSSNSSPPQPMMVPGIIASQVIYPSPGSPMGMVILTWDGGPDHPFVEVWYKVNNGKDTFLIEKGKGSLQVPAERYKAYTYILTDAGKTLRTVSFVAP